MLILLFLLSPCLVFCNIINISSFNEIKNFLNQVDENDLVIFDVDGTLIQPTDMVLRPCGEFFFIQQFTKLIEKHSEARIKWLCSKILLERQLRVVDPDLVDFIVVLQSRSVKIMALTSLMTGSFGAIRNMEEWRVNELMNMGFDFSGAFPKYNHIVFGDIRKENSLPIFKDGILFSSRHSKGEVLNAFLQKIKWMPKKIIYIDDMRTHIDSVEAVLEDLPCESICYHYSMPEQDTDKLDEEVAMKQLLHLQIHGAWLSDGAVSFITLEEGNGK